MDVTPDDIREAVTRIYPATGSVLFTDIAKALMAERERCAKIADREAERAQALYDAVEKWDVGQLSDDKIKAQLYRELAAAIRSGNRRA